MNPSEANKMTDSINAITPVSRNSELPPATTVAPQTPRPTTVTDTAVVSETAKAALLQQDGQSIAEIAVTLGITVSQVNTDLGVAAASAPLALSPQAPGAPAPATQKVP